MIAAHRGKWGLVWGLLRELPLLVMMQLHMYSNQRSKERLLEYAFCGETLDVMRRTYEKVVAQRDARVAHFSEYWNAITVQALAEALEAGNRVYVISASPVEWVRLYMAELMDRIAPGYGADAVTILGSQLELKDGRITGQLVGRNCYGEEKVNRLVAAVPDLKDHREDYHVTHYGDSRGDREMLEFADEGHLIR